MSLLDLLTLVEKLSLEIINHDSLLDYEHRQNCNDQLEKLSDWLVAECVKYGVPSHQISGAIANAILEDK